MTCTKVAVVTAGNKGIGYAIVKGLCEKYDGKVYLTSRDEDYGKATVNKLKELGFNPLFHQLDIDNEESIMSFRDYIKKNEGGIDVLVNNAGIAFKNNATEPVGIQAERTVGTNYFSTLRACEILFPLLRLNAQVVNVSSSSGHLSKIPSAELRCKLSDSNLTISQLSALMDQFVQDAKNNKHVENGWGGSTYNVSKVGVSALTVIQQREFNKDNKNISVNSVHPGYVDTDMSSHKGPLTIKQGASAPLFLALGNHGLKGQYMWSDSNIADWTAPNTPKEEY